MRLKERVTKPASKYLSLLLDVYLFLLKKGVIYSIITCKSPAGITIRPIYSRFVEIFLYIISRRKRIVVFHLLVILH